MGMYDSVIFSCPKCGGEIEEQSKAGGRELNKYYPNSVPVAIANDICDLPVWCPKCDTRYLIKLAIEAVDTYPLKLVEPQ